MIDTILNPQSAIRNRVIKVLTIAGSDPSGGAGIQVDLKTFQALGPSAWPYQQRLPYRTAEGQSSRSRRTEGPLCTAERASFGHQTRRDQDRNAATAMLLRLLQRQCKDTGSGRVVDPVIRSSSGKRLLSTEGVRSLPGNFCLCRDRHSQCTEAEVLAGMKIRNTADMDYAAGRILDLGEICAHQGGHRTGLRRTLCTAGRRCSPFQHHAEQGISRYRMRTFIGNNPVHCPDSLWKGCGKSQTVCDSMLVKAKPVGKGRTKYFQFG